MSSTSSTIPPPKPFPFLSLPPEIRNRIYKLCLCVGTCYVVDPRNPKEKRNRRKPDVAILLCSKHIYSEAISILYGENAIHLPWNLDEMVPLDFRAIDAIQFLEVEVADKVVGIQQLEWFTEPYRRLKNVDFTIPDRFVFDFLTIPVWRQENPNSGQVPEIKLDIRAVESDPDAPKNWPTGENAADTVEYHYTHRNDHSLIFQYCLELAQIKLKTTTYFHRIEVLQSFRLNGWAFECVSVQEVESTTWMSPTSLFCLKWGR